MRRRACTRCPHPEYLHDDRVTPTGPCMVELCPAHTFTVETDWLGLGPETFGAGRPVQLGMFAAPDQGGTPDLFGDDGWTPNRAQRLQRARNWYHVKCSRCGHSLTMHSGPDTLVPPVGRCDAEPDCGCVAEDEVRWHRAEATP